MVKIILVAFMVQLSGCSWSKYSQKNATIFYKSFDTETFFPVTSENMERQANCRFEEKESSQRYRQLISLALTGSKTTVDYEYDVRVKIVRSEGSPIYLRRDRITRFGEGPDAIQMSEDTFSTLRLILRDMVEGHCEKRRN